MSGPTPRPNLLQQQAMRPQVIAISDSDDDAPPQTPLKRPYNTRSSSGRSPHSPKPPQRKDAKEDSHKKQKRH